MGLNPTPYSEIEAYGNLMQIEFKKWEVVAIRRLDNAALREAERRMKSPRGGLKNETSAKDGIGVSSLIRGFGKKKA